MRGERFKRLFPALSTRDHIRAPMIAADHLSVLIQKPLDAVCQDGELLAEGLLKARQIYQPDFLIVFSDIAVEAEALGVELRFSKSLNPHVVRHPDISRLDLVNMQDLGRLPQLFKAAKICKQSLPNGFPIFFSMKDPVSLAATVMGSEEFLISMIEQPHIAEKLMNTVVENQKLLISHIIRQGYIPLVGAPISSGSLIGPAWFAKYAEPCLNRLFEVVREVNSFCCMHICGEVSNLASSIQRLNLDLLSFEEWNKPMWDILPDTIPMGYVPTELFIQKDESKLKSNIEDCLRNMPRPFVLSTACDLPMSAEPALVKLMMKYKSKYKSGNV